MPALHFTDNGQGPPLVLVHSFPADGRIWADVAAILSQSFRVITPDLRGFGKNPPVNKLTIAEMASDVADLARHLGIAPCAMAGLSMGGYVIQAVARDHADVINRLILVDTKAAADAPLAREARDAIAALAIEHGAQTVFQKMRPNLLAADASPAVVERLRTIAEAQPDITIAAAARAMRDRDDFSALLPTLHIPIHLIFGEFDAMMPPEAAKALHSALQAMTPPATLAHIAGAGHLSPLEKPREVAAAIAASLR